MSVQSGPTEPWRDAYVAQAPTRFASAVREVDWRRRPPEDIVEAVRAALALGLEALAERLAREGHAAHPDHEELSRFAHVLAPPRIVGWEPAQPLDAIRAARRWLRENRDSLRGQWALFKDGKLLAAAARLEDIPEHQADVPDPMRYYLTWVEP